MKTFMYGNTEINVEMVDGAPWFSASDACKAIDTPRSSINFWLKNLQGQHATKIYSNHRHRLFISGEAAKVWAGGLQSPEGKKFLGWLQQCIASTTVVKQADSRKESQQPEPVQELAQTSLVVEDPAVQTFVFDTKQVRLVMKEDIPWFVAKDVCDVLEIKNVSDTLTKVLDEDEKGVDTIYTLGGKQEMAIINEPGLYSLILRSRKQEAKQFKRWVTHEVLPSIRKSGLYMTAPVAKEATEDPETFLARAVLVAHERLAAQAKQITELKNGLEEAQPAMALFESISNNGHWFTMPQAAEILGCAKMGYKNLFKFMREKGWIKNAYYIYQHYIEAGYFQLHGYSLMIGGVEEPKVRVRVSYRGLAFLAKHLRDAGYKVAYNIKMVNKDVYVDGKKVA